MMLIAFNRPRRASGTTSCRIVLRKIELTTSAPFAIASSTSASGNIPSSRTPNAAIASPHTVTAMRTVNPWRFTRDVHPDATAATSAPTPIEA